jgi:hypothetical protein
MKSILSQSQANIGIASLAIGLLNFFATVSVVKAVPHSFEIAQVQQDASLKNQFFDLIIQSKFAISDLQAAVKSLVYNQDFKSNIIKLGGKTGYQTNITNSQQTVKKKITEVKQRQQAIVKFFDEHQEFINSLSPEVRGQAVPIVTLNIPAQMKVWEKEQREQDREWKCSGSTTQPICF